MELQNDPQLFLKKDAYLGYESHLVKKDKSFFSNFCSFAGTGKIFLDKKWGEITAHILTEESFVVGEDFVVAYDKRLNCKKLFFEIKGPFRYLSFEGSGKIYLSLPKNGFYLPLKNYQKINIEKNSLIAFRGVPRFLRNGPWQLFLNQREGDVYLGKLPESRQENSRNFFQSPQNWLAFWVFSLFLFLLFYSH